MSKLKMRQLFAEWAITIWANWNGRWLRLDRLILDERAISVSIDTSRNYRLRLFQTEAKEILPFPTNEDTCKTGNCNDKKNGQKWE